MLTCTISMSAHCTWRWLVLFLKVLTELTGHSHYFYECSLFSCSWNPLFLRVLTIVYRMCLTLFYIYTGILYIYRYFIYIHYFIYLQVTCNISKSFQCLLYLWLKLFRKVHASSNCCWLLSVLPVTVGLLTVFRLLLAFRTVKPLGFHAVFPLPLAFLTGFPLPLSFLTELPLPLSFLTELPLPLSFLTLCPSTSVFLTILSLPLAFLTQLPLPLAFLTEFPLQYLRLS